MSNPRQHPVALVGAIAPLHPAAGQDEPAKRKWDRLAHRQLELTRAIAGCRYEELYYELDSIHATQNVVNDIHRRVFPMRSVLELHFVHANWAWIRQMCARYMDEMNQIRRELRNTLPRHRYIDEVRDVLRLEALLGLVTRDGDFITTP